jgi:hypothetical protein
MTDYVREDSTCSHPRRRMIGAYGNPGGSQTQARQSQLGPSHSARSRSAY